MSSATLPRPAERVAIVSLLLVFLCGGAVGGVAMSYWFHRHGAPPAANGLTMSTGEWKDKLDLSEDQTRQLMSVLDDFAHYYDNLLADGNSRILQILNPQQKIKYEQMIRDHRK